MNVFLLFFSFFFLHCVLHTHICEVLHTYCRPLVLEWVHVSDTFLCNVLGESFWTVVVAFHFGPLDSCSMWMAAPEFSHVCAIRHYAHVSYLWMWLHWMTFDPVANLNIFRKRISSNLLTDWPSLQSAVISFKRPICNHWGVVPFTRRNENCCLQAKSMITYILISCSNPVHLLLRLCRFIVDSHSGSNPNLMCVHKKIYIVYVWSLVLYCLCVGSFQKQPTAPVSGLKLKQYLQHLYHFHRKWLCKKLQCNVKPFFKRQKNYTSLLEISCTPGLNCFLIRLSRTSFIIIQTSAI